MGAHDPEEGGWMAELLAGSPTLRDRLLARLRAAPGVHEAGEAATGLLLHTLADFADFRGLGEALAAFDAARPAGLRADAVRLGRPALDHRYRYDDPELLAARERVVQALRAGSAVPAEERLLLAKVLLDHDGMAGNDAAPLERLLAQMQELLPQAGPRWQAAWWRLRVQVLEFAGRTAAARQAQQRLQAVAAASADPELALALAGEEMRLALHVDDRPRAERAYRTIEQLLPQVRPALMPHGLRHQVALLLRRGEYQAAMDRTRVILGLCEEHEVPERDRAGYVEQQAYALLGLGWHAEAVARLESLRATQAGGQAGILEALIALARAVQALDEGRADADAAARHAVRLCAAEGFHRFLMSFPGHAARIAAIGLDAGVETEFLTRAVRERHLVPPDPAREAWPWAVQVRVLGGLAVRRDGAPLGSAGGKAQKKPLELLALLAAHPAGLEAGVLIDALWPSLEAEAPRASLEMAVSRLRKWLDCPEAVRVADGRVALDPKCVWTDVAALDATLQAGQAEAALALYRGPLLAGERLGPLLHRARARLAHGLAAVVLQRTAALRAQGRDTEALALLGRALAAEPGSEVLRAALAR
jgi:hypothetical protein